MPLPEATRSPSSSNTTRARAALALVALGPSTIARCVAGVDAARWDWLESAVERALNVEPRWEESRSKDSRSASCFLFARDSV